MAASQEYIPEVPDCFGRQACYCFEKLPIRDTLSKLNEPSDYIKFNIKHVQAHVDLLYKHQLADQLLNSSNFTSVQARYVKNALESQITTLNLFEQVVKNS